MPLKFFCFLFLLFTIPQTSIKANSIIGFDIAIADTSLKTTESKFNAFIEGLPLLKPAASNDKGIAKLKRINNKTDHFLFAVLLLFIFSVIRLIFSRYFDNLLHIFTTLHISKRHIKDQLENDNRASLWFYCIYLIVAAYIVYQFVVKSNSLPFSEQWYIRYAVSLVGLIFLIGLRTGALRLLGWVFNNHEYVDKYLFSRKLSNEFLGIVLFPLCMIIMIGSPKIQQASLMIAVILSLSLIIYNYLRNFPILRNLFRISFIHFLLYICAFEVMPVLILIKVFS